MLIVAISVSKGSGSGIVSPGSSRYSKSHILPGLCNVNKDLETTGANSVSSYDLFTQEPEKL